VVAQTPVASTVLLASTDIAAANCMRSTIAESALMVGSMGCVLPLALGLALARPDLRVVAWTATAPR